MLVIILIVLSVLGLQTFFFRKTYFLIKELNSIFPDSLQNGVKAYYLRRCKIIVENPGLPDEEISIGNYEENKELTSVPPGKIQPEIFEAEVIRYNAGINLSPLFLEIVQILNTYIIRNKGVAADINYIREMVERAAAPAEEKIAASINIPIRLGLIGTFLGIIVALIFLAGTNENVITSEVSYYKNEFLYHLAFSITLSFTGLLFTSVNSLHFYREVRELFLENKYRFINFLQSELLPVLTRDVHTSLTNMRNTMDWFSKEFAKNIGKFKTNVGALSENLALQKDFLEAIGQTGYSKAISNSTKLVSAIMAGKEEFDKFGQYILKIQDALNKSDESSRIIEELLGRLYAFEKAVLKLDSNVKESEEQSTMRVEFFSESVSKFNERTDKIIRHINETDEEIRQFLDKEKEALRNLTQKAVDDIEFFIKGSDSNSLIEKLNVLNSIDEKIQKMNDELSRLNLASTPAESVNPDSDLTKNMLFMLRDIAVNMRKMNEKMRPSIFRPIELIRYLLAKKSGK